MSTERRYLSYRAIRAMLPTTLDELPMPVEFRLRLTARRRTWTGIGWLDDGPADGTEPVLVTEDEPQKDPPSDWLSATCYNVRTPKGPCCYCGKVCKAGQGYIAFLDGFVAHYDCAPGLGKPTAGPPGSGA